MYELGERHLASDFDQVSRVTSKGQVTIPVRVRKLLGIREGW